jgi:hypothetical protein
MSGLASLKKTINGTLEINNTVFEYTIYPNPHKRLPTNINSMSNKEKEDFDELLKIISIFGNRKQANTLCLGIDENFVKENISKQNYAALIIIKNSTKDDSTTASLQYWNWCGGDPEKNKQLWINDLCRINKSNSSVTSPTLALFHLIEYFSKARKIKSNYLMVEKNTSGTDKLISIYSKYGFVIDESCPVNDMITMKKNIKNSGGKRKTIRRSRFLLI